MTPDFVLWLALLVGQTLLGVAACLAAWRALRGPRAQDRVLGLDALYITAMLLFLVTGMRMGSPYLFEGALVIGVIGFVATITLAKFLIRGEVIE